MPEFFLVSRVVGFRSRRALRAFPNVIARNSVTVGTFYRFTLPLLIIAQPRGLTCPLLDTARSVRAFPSHYLFKQPGRLQPLLALDLRCPYVALGSGC